jgi:hypothetical protein
MRRLYMIARELAVPSVRLLACCRAAGVGAHTPLSAVSAKDEARLRGYIQRHSDLAVPGHSARAGTSATPRGLTLFLRRVAGFLLVTPVALIIWVFGLWENQSNPWNRFYYWLCEGLEPPP